MASESWTEYISAWQYIQQLTIQCRMGTGQPQAAAKLMRAASEKQVPLQLHWQTIARPLPPTFIDKLSLTNLPRAILSQFSSTFTSPTTSWYLRIPGCSMKPNKGIQSVQQALHRKSSRLIPWSRVDQNLPKFVISMQARTLHTMLVYPLCILSNAPILVLLHIT